jgi:hypothetical protein
VIPQNNTIKRTIVPKALETTFGEMAFGRICGCDERIVPNLIVGLALSN